MLRCCDDWLVGWLDGAQKQQDNQLTAGAGDVVQVYEYDEEGWAFCRLGDGNGTDCDGECECECESECECECECEARGMPDLCGAHPAHAPLGEGVTG